MPLFILVHELLQWTVADFLIIAFVKDLLYLQEFYRWFVRKLSKYYSLCTKLDILCNFEQRLQAVLEDIATNIISS